MLKKLSVSILLATAVSAGVYAQQTRTMIVPLPDLNDRQIFTYNGGSYLGVQAREVTKENFGKFGLREVRGVAVETVSENSPAARAGLQKGDVIVKFNGEEIESTRKLTRLIAETAPDHQANLTVSRDGSEREISVTLEKRQLPQFENGSLQTFGSPEAFVFPQTPLSPMSPPSGRLMPAIPIQPGVNVAPNFYLFRSNSRQIGVGTTSLSKQLAEYFGAAEGGILINSVRENSPAAKAGLKAGDVIVEIDGKKSDDVSDLSHAFNAKTEGEFNLTIVRDKNRQNVRVTPETVKNDNGDVEKLFENVQPPRPPAPAKPNN